jgi:hypothetical protein
VINLANEVAQNVAISLDYYIFLQLQASKSSPIDEKSLNLVTLMLIPDSAEMKMILKSRPMTWTLLVLSAFLVPML